jgi:predicted dehydrogenase
MSEIGFGIIGAGMVARYHAQALAATAGARLVAICRSDAARAAEAAAEFGVPCEANLEALLARRDVDAIVSCTPSGLHARDALAAARAGKHVLVEKPMALLLADADRMIAACREAGVRLGVVLQRRTEPAFRALHDAIRDGELGDLVLGSATVPYFRSQSYYESAAWRGTWALDGGVLSNQASHHIDMLEWMMGDVESVFAMSSTALVRIEAEDTAIVALRFKNGALGLIEATTATRPRDLEGSISILGEGGTVEVGGFAMNEMKVWNFVHAQPGDEEVMRRYSVNPPDVYGFGHHAYYDHVVDCIVNEKRHLVDGLEGRKSLELISAIYESVETGREVPLRFRARHARLGQR